MTPLWRILAAWAAITVPIVFGGTVLICMYNETARSMPPEFWMIQGGIAGAAFMSAILLFEDYVCKSWDAVLQAIFRPLVFFKKLILPLVHIHQEPSDLLRASSVQVPVHESVHGTEIDNEVVGERPILFPRPGGLIYISDQFKVLAPFRYGRIKRDLTRVTNILIPLCNLLRPYKHSTRNSRRKKCAYHRVQRRPVHKISSRKRFGVVLYRYKRNRKPAMSAAWLRASGQHRRQP